MKILVDARTMGSCPSGIGIYLYDFVRELISNRNFDFVLVTDVEESEQIHSLSDRGARCFCYGKRVFRSGSVFSYFRFVERILKAEQPDLFWEPNNLMPVRLRGFQGKIVLTIHDFFPIVKPEYFSGIYQFYFKWGIRKSIKQADAILFNSAETKKQAQELFPSVTAKQNFISYLIVQKPPARCISDDGFFLYIGNLEKRKGTDLLLSAYRKYRQAGGMRPLYLGGNVREADIGKRLQALQTDYPEVRYLGYLGEEKKYDVLSRCHCFLFPSQAEGFGLPPLEALCYQKPVITSDLTIFREILKAPVQTFQLGANAEEQLCSQMLAERYWQVSEEEALRALEYYRGKRLGGQLASFFLELSGGAHEGCI